MDRRRARRLRVTMEPRERLRPSRSTRRAVSTMSGYSVSATGRCSQCARPPGRPMARPAGDWRFICRSNSNIADRSIMCRQAHYIPVNAIARRRRSRYRHARPVSAMVSSTGWISVGELAITPRISLVAVCCSSDSLSSLEQPHVLDGDHRLVGEGFEELDLRRGEGAHFGATRVQFQSVPPADEGERPRVCASCRVKPKVGKSFCARISGM